MRTVARALGVPSDRSHHDHTCTGIGSVHRNRPQRITAGTTPTKRRRANPLARRVFAKHGERPLVTGLTMDGCACAGGSPTRLARDRTRGSSPTAPSSRRAAGPRPGHSCPGGRMHMRSRAPACCASALASRRRAHDSGAQRRRARPPSDRLATPVALRARDPGARHDAVENSASWQRGSSRNTRARRPNDTSAPSITSTHDATRRDPPRHR